MSFAGGNKPKNRKQKDEVSNSNVVKTEKPVRPFNFGGSNKSNNRGKGPLAGTNGAVFI